MDELPGLQLWAGLFGIAAQRGFVTCGRNVCQLNSCVNFDHGSLSRDSGLSIMIILRKRNILDFSKAANLTNQALPQAIGCFRKSMSTQKREQITVQP